MSPARLFAFYFLGALLVAVAPIACIELLNQ